MEVIRLTRPGGEKPTISEKFFQTSKVATKDQTGPPTGNQIELQINLILEKNVKQTKNIFSVFSDCQMNSQNVGRNGKRYKKKQRDRTESDLKKYFDQNQIMI